ncbi:MAG TPA: tRNA (guanosine(37)-N1)-methyltransferase TrmD [Acidimicrobiales bacterium]|nr:tRNA (guanosine(37)-N1)-methyltransferase TrmD [Acidimicrobiales bacterium]
MTRVAEAGSLSPLRIDVLTIFPGLVESYCAASVIGRGQRLDLLDIRVHDLRSGATDERRSVDDSPFGGGAGMVLAPEPVFAVVERESVPRPLYLMSPAGRRFDQAAAAGLAGLEGGFSLLCGRYEGIDDRVATHLVDGEWSIGDYVLAGGELAALVILEAVGRLTPGVVGNEASIEEESFSSGLLEYPQYTRPAEFRGWTVPEVLLSGDHGKVARWRHAAALARTLERRPDLIAVRGGLTAAEARLLVEHGYRVPAEAGQGEANLPPG